MPWPRAPAGPDLGLSLGLPVLPVDWLFAVSLHSNRLMPCLAVRRLSKPLLWLDRMSLGLRHVLVLAAPLLAIKSPISRLET